LSPLWNKGSPSCEMDEAGCEKARIARKGSILQTKPQVSSPIGLVVTDRGLPNLARPLRAKHGSV
jgi:hypothetical protein